MTFATLNLGKFTQMGTLLKVLPRRPLFCLFWQFQDLRFTTILSTTNKCETLSIKVRSGGTHDL